MGKRTKKGSSYINRIQDPLSYNVENLSVGASYASLSVAARADHTSNLHGLYVPADNRLAVGPVRYGFTLLGPNSETLEPLVTQFYPAYQETIWGTEGLILTQRIFAPYETAYERGVCWLIEVQAEGPRVLQVEVTLEFGLETPTTLRMQDGLLVATDETNPSFVRVFGSNGPPSYTDLTTPGRARLVYHILIEGEVEQPFILSVSGAGEALAWNGFLALSDTERAFRDTLRNLDARLAQTQVYTPDAQLNRGLEWAKINALRAQQRGRWGVWVAETPGSDRVDVSAAAWYALGASWLTPDFVGRLLYFLATHAQAEDGGVCASLMAHDRGRQAGPSDPRSTALYLVALCEHLNLTAEVTWGVQSRELAGGGQGQVIGIGPTFAQFYPSAQSAADYLAHHIEPGGSLAEIAWGLSVMSHTALRFGQMKDAARFGAAASQAAASGSGLPSVADGAEGVGGHALGQGKGTRLVDTLLAAYALRERAPERMRQALRLIQQVAEPNTMTPDRGVAPGQLPRWVDAETGQAAGAEVDTVAGALAFGLAMDDLLGLGSSLHGLTVNPHLPPDWGWIAMLEMPYQGRRGAFVFINDVLHTTVKTSTQGRVEVYDRAEVIPGEVLAILFQRPGVRRLFAASDRETMTYIRIGGRSIPVQLEAGQAVLMNLDEGATRRSEA